MHELSIVRGLVDAVERRLQSATCRVLRIDLEVGSATGIVAAALRQAFEIVAGGTRAEGARLVIHDLPARCRCSKCGVVFKFSGMIGHCTACGTFGGELLSGDEMIVRSMEVADV